MTTYPISGWNWRRELDHRGNLVTNLFGSLSYTDDRTWYIPTHPASFHACSPVSPAPISPSIQGLVTTALADGTFPAKGYVGLCALFAHLLSLEGKLPDQALREAREVNRRWTDVELKFCGQIIRVRIFPPRERLRYGLALYDHRSALAVAPPVSV